MSAKVTKQGIKNSLATNVKSTAETYSASVTNNANNLTASFKNASETKVNQVAGEVQGGIQSVTNLTKDVTGNLNTGAVEGIVTDKLTALENAVQDVGNTILTSADKNTQGIRLNLTWSDPDSDGNVRLEAESIDVSAMVDTSINAMLEKITGMKVFDGYLGKVAGNVTPKGVGSLIEELKGKVGAFPSVDKLNELTEKANTLAAETSAGINDAVSAVQASTNLPAGASAAVNDIGKNLAGTATGTNAKSQLAALGDSLSNAVGAAVTTVSNTITKGIEINTDNLRKDFESQTGKVGEDVFNDVTKGFDDNLAKLESGIDNYNAGVSDFLSGSESGVIQGFGEKLSQKGASVVRSFGGNLTDKEVDEIVSLSQGSKADQDKSIDLLTKKSGKARNDVKNSLQDLDTTIAGTITVSNEESAFADPFSLESTGNFGSADSKFTYVSSVEELESEINQINREVTEVVVHWSDTYTNKNIGSEEINKSHISLGIGKGIGYHYVIRRDGSLQRGRPVNTEGEHAISNGHDKYSIGLVLVGGINAPSGTEFATTYRSAESFTSAQMNTFKEFCQAFFNRYPGGQILGHNDIDPLEQDPGFDVRDYVEDLFNKKSLFEDPSSRGPFKPAELNTTQIPS